VKGGKGSSEEQTVTAVSSDRRDDTNVAVKKKAGEPRERSEKNRACKRREGPWGWKMRGAGNFWERERKSSSA